MKPFKVYMTDKGGVGVTVVSHDSEGRTLVRGFLAEGSYSRSINYTEADIAQLANLTASSAHCESTSATTQCSSSMVTCTAGGCHVMERR